MSGEQQQPAQQTGHEADLNAGLEDRRLVDRCVRGEVAAWEELYARCHPSLLDSVEFLLGRHGSDPHTVDEIAARVWYAMVDNDGELLDRYDPGRGTRLVTFFRAVAKDMISRYFRTERRRLRLELEAYRESARHRLPGGDDDTVALNDFLGTLTPYERSFCGEELLSPPAESGVKQQTWPSSISWQLTFRIRQKLISFLAGEDAEP